MTHHSKKPHSDLSLWPPKWAYSHCRLGDSEENQSKWPVDGVHHVILAVYTHLKNHMSDLTRYGSNRRDINFKYLSPLSSNKHMWSEICNPVLPGEKKKKTTAFSNEFDSHNTRFVLFTETHLHVHFPPSSAQFIPMVMVPRLNSITYLLKDDGLASSSSDNAGGHLRFDFKNASIEGATTK